MIAQARSYLFSLLPKDPFARGVSVLVSGTTAAQVLLILATPLLTRLYSPEDFGLLAVYVSLLAIIVCVASMRYELAIPVPEDDQYAANIVALCLLTLLGTTLLTVLPVFYFRESIATSLGTPLLAGYLWLLPIGVLLGGAYAVLNYWAVRTMRFTAIAGTKLRQALAMLVIQLTAFKLGPIALLLGQVAGQGVGTAQLARGFLSALPVSKSITWRKIKHAAKRYRRFPIYSSWSGLLNTAGHQFPPIFFAAFFGAGAAGLYLLAHRILMLPATLIGAAISNVFFSYASHATLKNKLSVLYSNVQDKLVQVGLPPALLLIVGGPSVFASLFGEEWRMAGVFAQWLAIGAFFGFLVSPLSVMFAVIEKQNIGLILQATLLAARVSAIVLGAWLGDVTLAVALFSLASMVGYLLYLAVLSKYANSRLTSLIKSLLESGFYSLVIISPFGLSMIALGDSLSYLALFATVFLMIIRYVFIAKTWQLKT